MLTTALDILRFTLITITITYAAYSDHKIGEVKNSVWIYFFFGLSLTLISFIITPETILLSLFSIGATTGLSLFLFYLGAWGGADAKAFITIACSLPITPFNLQPLIYLYPLAVLLLASTFSFIGAYRQKNVPWLQRKVRFLPYTVPCLFIALLF